MLAEAARDEIAIIGQIMSKTRQNAAPDGSLVRSFGVTFHSPFALVYPAPGWDRLLYATQGVLRVDTAAGSWVLPAHRALWVPDGKEHSLHPGPGTAMRSLFFRAGQARRLPRRICAVNVTPLLRELVLATTSLGALSARKAAHRRLAGVLLDQMAALPGVPLQLPWPRSADAQELAVKLQAEPGLSLAATAGRQQRTLERRFREETGLSLGAWQRRLRLRVALEGLAEGRPVREVAARCGYNGASAFVAMFRREFWGEAE